MASTARLDELKKKFDENPRRYFAPLANEHRKSGDLDQAIALCRAHLPQQPAHISGHIVLAQALFEAGSPDEAREIFHTALGLDPENLIALRYLGDIARETDDVATARQWYQRVLEVDPRNDEIVQLVRDLDAPPQAPVETSELTPSAVPADPAETPAPEPLTAENNPRFAPLSLEAMDLETDDLSAAPVSSEGDATAQFDVDASGIDPFDLDLSAASAESLYDANTEPPADDLLIELSQPVTSDDDSAQIDAAAAWASAAETDAAVSQPTSETNPSAFVEEWDVAEAPAAPNAGSSAANSEPGFEATSDVVEVNDVAAESQPADISSDLTERPTAEWHAPSLASLPPESTSAANDLGLEVMEFVPPSREVSSQSVPEAPADADAMLGRTPELLPVDQAATPASFVTETMAELYLQQGFRNEALAVYRELLARNPADANLRERVEQIESGSMSSIGMATLSESIVESALKRQSGRSARSVRSFFASLAGRRAPASESRPVDDSASIESFYAGAEYIDAEPAPAESTESASADAEFQSDRTTPHTAAAESLTTFDPFADPGTVSPDMLAAPASELVMAPEPQLVVPNVDPATPPSASAANSTTQPSERRSLEDLFPESPITARTEVVAQTLATAFGRPEPQGRPTRAASSELSLDNVFRGAPEGAPPSDGGFSFDQFFSDARPAGGDVAAAISPPDAGRSGGGTGDAHDIEQFTAWLEGLKKK